MKLSTKIKNLVASGQFQEVVKKYGFADVVFVEPIIAIVVHNKIGEKYLVYKYINQVVDYSAEGQFPNSMVQEIKELFVKNEIAPHDLRSYQFMEARDENDTRHLFLIDIEAYTEMDEPKSLS